MATIRVFLGLICFAFVGSSGRNGGYLLKEANVAAQNKVMAVAVGQLGVREATGNNDGVSVEEYLHLVGLKKGQPWCAAFVSWVFSKAGFPQPRTAWSPSLFPTHRLRHKPAVAQVYGLYFSDQHRIAHCGIVRQVQHDWIIGIEGNTNTAGSNEGDGVYQKMRHQRTIRAYAAWLPEKKGAGQ